MNTELSPKPDDDELSSAIGRIWVKSIRYLHHEWHKYEGGCWQTHPEELLKMDIRRILRTFRTDHVEITIRNGLVNGLENLLEQDLFMTDGEFNALVPQQEQYINLRNGLYNLSSFKLEPHRPELMFTAQHDFDYDPQAQCPVWERYLNSSLLLPDGSGPDDELILLVQEAMAYSMTARTDMKASFWLVGKPDSGKSTLLAFIKGLMGSLHGTIDLNKIGDSRFMLSSIIGKRVVTFSEAEDGSILPDALYKAIVGGVDEIYADVKNKPGITFKPMAKIWWGMNGSPRVTDRSGATVNRVIPIPFEHTIPVARRVSNLHEQLMSERSGVFNWMMDGYARLGEKKRFTAAKQSVEWKENFRTQNDTEKVFINDRLERNTNERIQSNALYRVYSRWCQDNGLKAKSMIQVAKEWERLGLTREVTNGRHFWRGVHNPFNDDGSRIVPATPPAPPKPTLPKPGTLIPNTGSKYHDEGL